MTVKTSVSLSDQQAAFARKLVEEGRYASISAVIQHGLDRLQMEREAEMADVEALRAVLEERRKGPFVSNADAKAQTAAMLARKRAVLGLDG
ncbi:type II toxin-antitoxin system ParD family antitoxin [Roseicyclus sp.]